MVDEDRPSNHRYSTDRRATWPDRGRVRRLSCVDDDIRGELEEIRASIDNIDAAVVHLLAERFKCTQRVGELKAKHHLPPADPARETRQIDRLRQKAIEADLDPAFAEKFLSFIIDEVIRHHEAARNSITE